MNHNLNEHPADANRRQLLNAVLIALAVASIFYAVVWFKDKCQQVGAGVEQGVSN